MKKILKVFLLLLLILIPLFPAQAQEKEGSFDAVVVEITDQQEKNLEDGSKITQQNIKLKGTKGEWKNKEAEFKGVSDFVVAKTNIYKKGDRVVVSFSTNPDGTQNFYISDYIRKSSLLILFLIFLLAVILVSKWKGVMAIISLGLSFFIIMKVILPLISSGFNPLLVSVIGAFFILFFIIYLTEGFNKRAHFAILSIAICLVITTVLSYIFTYFTKLTGMAQEEVLFLVAAGKGSINFQGLLLAGIIIGTLGVLDDIVISQIEAIRQIKKANPDLEKTKVLKMAGEIGSSHLGAIINTLFLAYAGVSLPLLMLFYLGEGSFTAFGQIINNEMIATEVVRTLVGVIGLTLSIPITNILMVYFYKPKQK